MFMFTNKTNCFVHCVPVTFVLWCSSNTILNVLSTVGCVVEYWQYYVGPNQKPAVALRTGEFCRQSMLWRWTNVKFTWVHHFQTVFGPPCMRRSVLSPSNGPLTQELNSRQANKRGDRAEVERGCYWGLSTRAGTLRKTRRRAEVSRTDRLWMC